MILFSYLNQFSNVFSAYRLYFSLFAPCNPNFFHVFSFSIFVMYQNHHAPPFFILFFIPFPNLKIPIPTQYHCHHHRSSHHCYGNTRFRNHVEAPEWSERRCETDERAPQLTLAGYQDCPGVRVFERGTLEQTLILFNFLLIFKLE